MGQRHTTSTAASHPRRLNGIVDDLLLLQVKAGKVFGQPSPGPFVVA